MKRRINWMNLLWNQQGICRVNDNVYDIALSYDESLTPIEKVALYDKYGSSKSILELSRGTLKNILGRKWTGARFNPFELKNKATKILPFLKKAGINIVRYDDEEFPRGLRMIPDHPFLIYYRGNIKFDYEKSISVVGTRKPDSEGLKRTQVFTEMLTKEKFTVVSGLALGIDAAAHYNCVINKGKTIAVLGCGIDQIYPYVNKYLARMILDNNGGIISEYPPGTIPKKWNFPRRNRIIVGLSRSVLITQSPSKSGSIISAILSTDYNRDLYVVSPKEECREKDAGNIELIFSGATEVNNPKDILKEYSYC